MEASEARELAEKIIILDDSIIACGFVTHNGIALAGATKDSFRSRMPKAEFWQRGRSKSSGRASRSELRSSSQTRRLNRNCFPL
jgi:hypothetical protein